MRCLVAPKGPEMGKHIDLPFWLQNLQLDFRFAEDEDSDDDDGDEDEDDADEDEDDEGEGKSKKKSSKGKKKKDDDEEDDDPAAGLKSALKKEREARRTAQKELKRLRGEQRKVADDKDKDEKTKSAEEAREAAAKADRLAARLQTNAVDTEIIKAISKLEVKFADVEDALRLINRSDIEVEQDEDDPSEIEVDSDSVVKALKRLAKKKPHLLVKEESDDSDDDEDDEDDEEDVNPPKKSTGGKVGSRGTRDKKKVKEDTLRETYPALRRTGRF